MSSPIVTGYLIGIASTVPIVSSSLEGTHQKNPHSPLNITYLLCQPLGVPSPQPRSM